MAEYKVRGPDPDGDYFVVHIKPDGNEVALDEAYPTEAKAQEAADGFDADPASVPDA